MYRWGEGVDVALGIFPRLFVEEKRLTGFPACSDVVVFCAVMSTFYFPRSDKHDGKAGSVCVGYA